jgi:hypothetical protein
MTSETKAADDPGSETYIDVSDEAAVDRWCVALGITDEALWKAVQEVGTRVDKIKDYLGAGSASNQEDG